MLSQCFDKTPFKQSHKSCTWQSCVIVGNWVMILSFVLTLACLWFNFGMTSDESIHLASQIAAHIGTIIFATFFKIGYVIRCIGAHHLGRQSF